MVDIGHSADTAIVGYVTDIEGDLGYWRRYVDISEVLTRCADGTVGLADGAHFVFGGDAVDAHPGDLQVLEELLALKRSYPDRVHLIIGNRDNNKLRLLVELGAAHREAVPMHEHPGLYFFRDATKKLSEEELKDNSPAARLRWILRHTMGAYDTFEHRRTELNSRKGSLDVSDEEVVESFLELLRPGGLLFEYLANARLAVQVHGTLFMHAGLPRGSNGWSPGWVPAWQSDVAQEGLPLEQWLQELDKIRMAAMAEVATTVGTNPGPDAWAVVGGYRHAQAGSALMQYGMRDMPDGTCQPSIVYNGWLDAAYQPMLPDEATCDWLRASGVSCVVCGHQPHGDAPLVLRVAEGLHAITADTSYAASVKWAGREASAASQNLAGRGEFTVCEVVLGPALGSARIHGVLNDGTAFQAMSDDKLVGRVTADGWRVKGRVGSQVLLSQNKGFDFTNRLADEQDVQVL